jgi:hypothetical protein
LDVFERLSPKINLMNTALFEGSTRNGLKEASPTSVRGVSLCSRRNCGAEKKILLFGNRAIGHRDTSHKALTNTALFERQAVAAS